MFLGHFHKVGNCQHLFIYQGWTKASHSLDASEENDGWSSAEDPLNSSDAEEEVVGGGEEMKLVTRNIFLPVHFNLLISMMLEVVNAWELLFQPLWWGDWSQTWF